MMTATALGPDPLAGNLHVRARFRLLQLKVKPWLVADRVAGEGLTMPVGKQVDAVAVEKIGRAALYDLPGETA